MNNREFLSQYLADGEDLSRECFPEMSTFSPAFFFQFVPVAKNPEAPEVLFVPLPKANWHANLGMMATWNFLWEAAQFRKEAIQGDRYLGEAAEVAQVINSLPNRNAYLVADTPSKYYAYSPLLHLLPLHLLTRFKIPALKRPIWPANASWWDEELMPPGFAQRLGSAFAAHVWPRLESGSPLRAFGAKEPLRLLSHNLDFWLPYAIEVMEELMRDFERCVPEDTRQRRLLTRMQKSSHDDVTFDRPRKGGTLWMGEDEANDVTKQIVEKADAKGRLRDIIDAIKSNRVADDFSSQWSFAKEDFERKLYSKRSKVKVSFVELTDTLPVHNRQTEYTEDLIWQDFFSMLDVKEKHVVVALRSGVTKLGEVAGALGYANHSPVSKALDRIRRKAATFLLN